MAPEGVVSGGNYLSESMNKKCLRIILIFILSVLTTAQTPVYQFYFPIILKGYQPPPSPKKGILSFDPQTDDLERLRSSWYQNSSPFPITWWQTRDRTPDARHIAKIGYAWQMAYLRATPDTVIMFARGGGYLAGFNEPDLAWQSNLTPAQAAVLWREIETAMPPEIKLISPQPSIHNPSWLWQFVETYQGIYGERPRMDAIGYNVYFRTAGEVQAYLTARHNEALAHGYDVPIWIMELGGECWQQDSGSAQLMSELIPWLEATDWIGRYSWFANRIEHFCDTACWGNCTLIDDNGDLSLLGQMWRGW